MSWKEPTTSPPAPKVWARLWTATLKQALPDAESGRQSATTSSRHHEDRVGGVKGTFGAR